MFVSVTSAADLQQETSRLRAHCSAIPADRYSTGLIFNPKGYETSYERSACFQSLALELRDGRLCHQARERTSLLFDGSGISPAACNRKIAEQIRQDAKDAVRLHKLQKLDALSLTRNGNRRDINVHIQTSGGAVASYRLALSLLSDDGGQRNLLSDWQPMDDQPGEIVLLIHQSSLIQALAGHPVDRAIRLRAALDLVPQSLGDQAVYSHVPRNERESVVETRFVPSALKPEPLTQVR